MTMKSNSAGAADAADAAADGRSLGVKETTPLLLVAVKNDTNEENPVENKEEEERKKWVWTTISLSLSVFAQSYLLVSVFPYSGFLAMHLVPSLNEETAGKYAGWIASSFMIGRTFSSYHWGKAADMYGRTWVIQQSLLLSAIFSILFGLSDNFALALFWRFCLGLSNGLVGPIKTLVSEISNGVMSRETQTLAIVFGMWGYGFLLNPAISGYLSDPVKQYPNISFLQQQGEGHHFVSLFLVEYPYFVPNLVGCIYSLVAYIFVTKYVEETLPKEKRKKFNLWQGPKQLLVQSISFIKFPHNDEDTVHDDDKNSNKKGEFCRPNEEVEKEENLPKWVRPSPSTTALTILSREIKSKGSKKDEEHIAVAGDIDTPSNEALLLSNPNSGSSNSNQKVGQGEKRDDRGASKMGKEAEEEATILGLLRRKSTRRHLLLYWIYSFGVTSLDEIFPLFCISKYSGLGVEESKIGNLLTGTGVGYVVIQYALVTKLVAAFGYYKTMQIGSLFSLPLCILLPLALVTNRTALKGNLTWSTVAFLSVIYAIIRSSASVMFSTMTVTTNNTVPAHHRATMNGLSMLGGSLAKGIGPVFAGILFSTSAANITPPFGSVAVYGVVAILGFGIFLQSLFLEEHKTRVCQGIDNCSEESSKSTQQSSSTDNNLNSEDDEESPPSF